MECFDYNNNVTQTRAQLFGEHIRKVNQEFAKYDAVWKVAPYTAWIELELNYKYRQQNNQF